MVFFLLCNAFQGLFSQDALFVVDLQNHFYGLNSIIGSEIWQPKKLKLTQMDFQEMLIRHFCRIHLLFLNEKNV